MITGAQIKSIEEYLKQNARPVDLALYNFHVHNGSVLDVLNELKKYQNEDGGFGNAIEPDLRLPQSTALATWMAFQFIKEVNPDKDNEVVQNGLNYFLQTYDKEKNGWNIIRPEVDEYPHAPWWDYETAMKHFGWGNPSAEILGLLIKYGDTENGEIVDSLKAKALARIHEVEPSSFHEVFCFKALYNFADENLKNELKEPLSQLITKATTTNPNEWGNYVATPLKFIASPNDPFFELFGKDLIDKNIEFIFNGMTEDHWEPNWTWSDNYPEDWETAKKEWSGHLTVNNLLQLKRFGVA